MFSGLRLVMQGLDIANGDWVFMFQGLFFF